MGPLMLSSQPIIYKRKRSRSMSQPLSFCDQETGDLLERKDDIIFCSENRNLLTGSVSGSHLSCSTASILVLSLGRMLLMIPRGKMAIKAFYNVFNCTDDCAVC